MPDTLNHVRIAWAFLRTMARDYRFGVKPGATEYPWAKLGPDYCPHLRYFVFQDGKLLTWPTRAAARSGARELGERGIPVKVRIRTDLLVQ